MSRTHMLYALCSILCGVALINISPRTLYKCREGSYVTEGGMYPLSECYIASADIFYTVLSFE